VSSPRTELVPHPSSETRIGSPSPGRGLGQPWASPRSRSRVRLTGMAKPQAKRRGISGSPSPRRGRTGPSRLPLTRMTSKTRSNARLQVGEGLRTRSPVSRSDDLENEFEVTWWLDWRGAIARGRPERMNFGWTAALAEHRPRVSWAVTAHGCRHRRLAEFGQVRILIGCVGPSEPAPDTHKAQPADSLAEHWPRGEC
jgi:hypothetical protein